MQSQKGLVQKQLIFVVKLDFEIYLVWKTPLLKGDNSITNLQSEHVKPDQSHFIWIV